MARHACGGNAMIDDNLCRGTAEPRPGAMTYFWDLSDYPKRSCRDRAAATGWSEENTWSEARMGMTTPHPPCFRKTFGCITARRPRSLCAL